VIRKWDALLAVAGLALFAFAAERIGWSAVIRAIQEARTAVMIILGLSLVRLILQTRSWSIALRADGIEAPAGQLMLIRLASQGMGYLSVLGPAASEPMKISLLKKPKGSATAATLVDTAVYWLTSGIVTVGGCLSAALLLTHHRRFRISLAVMALILAGVLYVIASPNVRLGKLVDRLGGRCPRWLRKAQQIEVALREFARQSPSSIRSMIWLGVACQLLMGAEVVAVFLCLKIPFHTATVLAVEGASRAVKILTSWMPARIGADESGNAGAFLAFGLSPASGLTLALARRSRDLLAALIGLSWLALSVGLWKVLPARVAEAPHPQVAYSIEEEVTCKLY
jgi:hypothetical protein